MSLSSPSTSSTITIDPPHPMLQMASTSRIYDLTWSISCFHELCADNIADHPYIFSLPFSVPSSDDNETAIPFQFKLQLYPKGFEDDSKDYLSLFISLVQSVNSIETIKYEFSLMDVGGRKHATKVHIQEFITNQKEPMWYGLARWIRRDEVFNADRQLLPNNALTIYCQIQVISHQLKLKPLLNPPTSQLKPMPPSIASLFGSTKFTDVTLELDDGTTIRAHKNILASRSPVFAALFEQSKLNVRVKELTKEVANQLLHYIYTGQVIKIEMKYVEVKALLIAADKFQLTELKAMCENYIGENIARWTGQGTELTELAQLIDTCSAQHLRATFTNFVRKQLTSTLDMILTDPQLAAEVDKIFMHLSKGF